MHFGLDYMLVFNFFYSTFNNKNLLILFNLKKIILFIVFLAKKIDKLFPNGQFSIIYNKKKNPEYVVFFFFLRNCSN